jgi:cholesterol transport system auxiliary component
MKYASITTMVSSLLLLSACSLFKSKEDAPQVYMLRPAAASGAVAVPGVLAVQRPSVPPGLDTDLIMLTRGQELNHFAGSRWGESLPRVVATLAVQSLAGAGGFANVAEAGRAGVASDFELLLVVRHFEAAYEGLGAAPVIQVAFDCTLTGGAPRRVLGRCDATASEPAEDNRMGAIVAAVETAAQRALGEVRSKAVAAAGTARNAPTGAAAR